MSGYLERLVSSARAPSRAIRPILGSFFSASMDPSAPGSFQPLEEISITRQPESLVPPAPLPPLAIPASPEPRPAERDLPRLPTQVPAAPAAVANEGSRPISEARTAFTPLVTEVRQDTTATLRHEGSRPISEARTPFTPLVAEVRQGTGPTLQTSGQGRPWENAVESAEARLELTDQHVNLQRPHTALAALSRTKPRTAQPSSPLVLAARGNERTDASSRMARPDRETDEVQIHIGRIEVTAVPPAPARPAAPPARKSLRLDEYLRRGRAL